MPFDSHFQPFRDKTRVVVNDRFMGDQGAKQLAGFLESHGRVQSLEIKSNDISSQGFEAIFVALLHNPHIRQLIVQYNNMGENTYGDWESSLCNLIAQSRQLQRLNISNNKITTDSFRRLVSSISGSDSLKLLEVRYNAITESDIELLTTELKQAKNTTLLYVELSGNKIKKQAVDNLEAYLKQNRAKNPLTKDRLMMTANFDRTGGQNSIVGNTAGNTFYMSKTNAIDDLSKENVVRHLEDILDENRKNTAEIKVRLQRQLEQLQRRQKNDSRQLNELDRKCNQLTVQNRNMKFELDRTVSEHQQMQRDHEHHVRVHEQKLQEANKQLVELTNKYEQVDERMAKQHQMKMKEIAREWEARLRSVQDKIRTSDNENNVLENEIKKNLQKKERLRIQYLEQESQIRSRVEDEQSQKYGFKISALQSRLRQLEQTRQRYLRRNQELTYQVEKTETNNQQEILALEEELGELKVKEEQFVQKNREFLNRNEKLKSDIRLKEINIQKLQEQVNRLNEEIQAKKAYNRQQVTKIVTDHAYSRGQRQDDKKTQIEKLNDLQATLRNSQLQNAKLRQQYAILAQRLQISLGQAVQQVFTENNFY